MRLLLLCLAATSLAFECDSGRLLPPSHLNDGYCDCADRTDEPRTGACPDTSFVCTNWPDVRVRLPASRVGDGVCDCCDGSDEPDGRCEETCVENAARRAALLERACLQRAELAREGREGVEKDAAKLEQARALLEERAPEIDVLRDAMESASAQEAAMLAERQARLESGELDRALGIERLTNPMLLVALARLALASGIDGVDNLYDTILSRSEFGGIVEDIDVADLLEVAILARDQPCQTRARETSEDASSSRESTQTCAAMSTASHEADLLALLRPLADAHIADLRALLREYYRENEQAALLAHTNRELLAQSGEPLDDQLVASALDLVSPFSHPPAVEAREAHAGALSAIERSRRIVDELSPHEAFVRRGDYGRDFEWRSLHGRCLSHSESSERYQVCPFRHFRQGQILVGNYSGWDPLPAGNAAKATAKVTGHKAVMRFEGGATCNRTPRTGRAIFECGEKEEVVKVSEPQACEYEATIISPAACSVEELAALLSDLQEATRDSTNVFVPTAQALALLGEEALAALRTR